MKTAQKETALQNVRASRGRRIASIILAIALAAALEGCATLYLHNAATQKQTDSARSALDAIKTDPIFNSEAAYLTQLEIEETAVVTQEFAALRDHDILVILNGPGPGPKPDKRDGLTLLKGRIVGDLQTLVGVSDYGCSTKLWRAVDVDALSLSDNSTDLRDFEKRINGLAATIRRSGCAIGPFKPLGVPSPTLADAGKLVLEDLNQREKLQKDADTEKASLKVSLKDLQSRLSQGNPTEAKVSADLGKLKTDLESANPYIKKYASATLNANVAATIDALNPTGAGAQSSLTARERSGIAVMQALFGVGDAFASPPRVPHPNALAAGQSYLNYVAAQANIQVQNEESLLKDHRAQFAAVLAEVYYLSKAGEQVQSSSALVNRPAGPGTEGLADIMSSKDERMNRAIDGAVMYYAEAWTRGFAAYQIASRHEYIDQRRGDLAVGRLAAAAWVGSLKPAVQTLANYGAGGFDPKVLARLIQSLGVAAIAVGVNK
jgi:hypothetical protein